MYAPCFFFRWDPRIDEEHMWIVTLENGWSSFADQMDHTNHIDRTYFKMDKVIWGPVIRISVTYWQWQQG